MELVFLQAGVPLTKSFTLLPDGAVDKSAYPLVKNFTSHHDEVDGIAEFAEALKRHAEEGHCLAKGLLKRPLKDEPRAQMTVASQPTLWSCFDLDNIKGIDTIEQFVHEVLPPAFHGASYVLQYSASAGIIKDAGVNAHIFFLHDQPFSPEQAKLFITNLNVEHVAIRGQLELTAAGTALRYRLDRSVMQNDKLIYIAPPYLGPGVTSSLGSEERISLVTKEKHFVDFDYTICPPVAAVEQRVDTKINELRTGLGLHRKAAKYRTLGSGERIHTNPDVAQVTGEKAARGFVYLNLNGGDSWGYYYAENNPRYLRNFKGEPTVILADMLPEYWERIQERMVRSDRDRPFAFRHRMTDVIWNGVYDKVNDRIKDLAPTTRGALQDFFMQYNVEVPAVIEDWRLEFNPTTLVQIDFENKFCNKWAPTEYMKQREGEAVLGPTIARVIRHVLGDDEVCYHYFMNWLAFIFQRREKTGTAWVIHGTQGTGKGILYSQILTPLFGERYCIQKQIGSLDDQFNAELETALIYNFDEGQLGSAASTKRAYARFKNMITEITASIRAMRSNAVQAVNYTNFLVSSNDYDAMGIEDGDRRMNVAPRQENKIKITLNDILAIKDELPAFARYLQEYKVSEIDARQALANQAKQQMREASQDWLEQMCAAVLNNDLDYFAQFYESSPPVGCELATWSSYNEVLRRYLRGPPKQVVTASEILTLYTYLSGNAMAPGKFGRMLKHKNLLIGPQYDASLKRTVRGLKVEWKLSDEYRTILAHEQSDDQNRSHVQRAAG